MFSDRHNHMIADMLTSSLNSFRLDCLNSHQFPVNIRSVGRPTCRNCLLSSLRAHTLKSHALFRRPEKSTQTESCFMKTRYDLFELRDGCSIWVGCANTIEEVKTQARHRVAEAPREWVILDQTTGHKSVLKPEQLIPSNNSSC